jgi:hypothetical protein
MMAQESTQPAGLALSGDMSADFVYGVVEPFDEVARTGGYSGAVSFNIDAAGGNRESAKLEASAVVRLLYGDAADAVRAAANLATGNEELVSYLIGADGPVMNVDLQKLYFSIYTRFADFSVGRMKINFGKGTVFSPLDLLGVVDTSDLELGRKGRDAVRVLVPFGDFSGIDLVKTMDWPYGDAVIGSRLYGNLAGWDVAFSAFGDGLADGSGDLAIGLDFKGDLIFGLSGEAMARVPVADWNGNATDTVYSLMAGVDYSIGGDWIFDAEYLCNIRSGSMYPTGSFRSTHNVFASVSWTPDELTALDLRCIAAPGDDALQATISVSRSVATGARLTAYALYRTGDVEGRYIDTGMPVLVDVERAGFGMRVSVSY